MRRTGYVWSGGLLCVLGTFVVIFMYGPTIDSLTGTLPSNLGDPSLTAWILSWESHALVSQPSRFFDGNAFYPYGDAIKYAEVMLPLVPVFGIIFWVTANPVLAHNLVTIGLAIFSLVTTFLLVQRLVGRWAALVAASSFSFSGYVFMHQSHLQLLTIGFFPLAFLALFRALEHRRLGDGVWLGVVTALLTTACLYYGAIWFVCLALIVIVDLVRLRRPPSSWWLTLTGAAIAIAVLVGPIAYVYASFHTEVPFVRDVGPLGLNPIDFLTPAPGSVVYGELFAWASARQPTGVVEHGFFVGFVVMGLAFGALVLMARNLVIRPKSIVPDRARYEIGLLTAAGLTSIVLAVGPHAQGLTMPFQFLSSWIPGYDIIRAASRLAVPGLLAIAVLAAWSVARLIARTSPETRLVVVSLVTALVLVEMWVTPLRADMPPAEPVRDVLRIAPEGAVVELPMRVAFDPEFAFVEGPRTLASIGDWRPRFNGYTGSYPPGYFDDVATMMLFPDAAAVERMRDLDLRYVILHGGEEASFAAFSPDQMDEILAALPEGVVTTNAGADWLVDLRPEA